MKLKLLFAGIAVFYLLPLILQAQTEKLKPNFLIILADDMGFSDAGCYGGEIDTPNLNKLASNGLRFTQAYSTARCWPSRSCLMTGYYAQQIRMDPNRRKRIPAWCRVLPHFLKPAGYRNYHSGKWHIGGAPKVVRDGGFDRSYVLHDHDRFFSPKRHDLNDQKLPEVPRGTGHYVTTDIADRAVGFLSEHDKKHSEKPFLLYLAFTAPHFPLHALPQDIEKYKGRYVDGWDEMRKRRWEKMRKLGLIDCELSARDPQTVPSWNFKPRKLLEQIGPGEVSHAVAWDSLTPAQQKLQVRKMAIHVAMVDRIDQEIGKVIAKIKAMDAFENTVIFFASDNGASAEIIVRGDKHDQSVSPGSADTYLSLGPGWATACNTPFRYYKSYVHEGGISSPLIIHWPRGISAKNELRTTPCHFIDLLPTVLELSGVEWNNNWKNKTVPALPGKSLVPTFAEDILIERDDLFFHHNNNAAIRVGDWKLVRKGRQGPWELYNIKNDRAESKNLLSQHPEKVEQLKARWRKHEKDFKALADQPD